MLTVCSHKLESVGHTRGLWSFALFLWLILCGSKDHHGCTYLSLEDNNTTTQFGIRLGWHVKPAADTSILLLLKTEFSTGRSSTNDGYWILHPDAPRSASLSFWAVCPQQAKHARKANYPANPANTDRILLESSRIAGKHTETYGCKKELSKEDWENRTVISSWVIIIIWESWK